MKVLAVLLIGAGLMLRAMAMPVEPDPAAAKPSPDEIADCTAKGGTIRSTR